MLAEHLEHAAALRRMIQDSRPDSLRSGELGRAVTQCCENLLLWGEAERALELLELHSDSQSSQDFLATLPTEILRLRAMLQLRRDREVLDRSEALITAAGELSFSERQNVLMVRVIDGEARWHLNRTSESLFRLEQLRTELLSAPATLVGAACSAAIASAHVAEGKWQSGREAAIEAWVLARRAQSRFHEGIAQNILCMAERGLCRWDNAIESADAAILAYEQIGAELQVAFARRSLAIVQWKKGRLAAAEESIERTLPVLLRGNHAQHVHYARLLQGVVALHRGDVVAAAIRLNGPALDSPVLAESRPELLRLEYLGDVELEQGHFDAALKRYDDALPHALALIPRGDVVAELRRRRAECLLHLGQPNEAFEEAKLALELCLELGDRYEEAATYRTLALAEAALGRRDEAKKHFVHGFAMYDDIETPYEWGKLWMSYGDWLCGTHAGPYESLAGAREAYRAACEHFEHMGAQLKLAHAKERLVRLEQRMTTEGILEPAAGEKPRPRRRPSLDREMQQRVQWAFDSFGVVTRHRPMIELLEQVATVAVSDIPVLVLGESGTDKELIARGVHALSGRTGSIVEVNCSAVPATMMEAEFFGSVHGSYTGSTRDRAGLFEEAHEGSIFLDEIGEMPVDLQAKLLRFLETGEVRRIGANAGRRVDARLIAATNREAARIQSGDGFRKDLYYRLAHAVFTLPPLRSRGDDTAILVDHFLDYFTAEARKRVLLSNAARERLLGHAWPGNVRQLRALLQRLVVQTPDGQTVTPRDLPLGESEEAPRNYNEELVSREKNRILEALEQAHYIKSDAARALRMSRTTLIGKMKRLGIQG